MPVVDDDPAAPAAPAPTPVRIAKPEFKSVTVDTRYEPAASLLTNIQGSSWITNYFSQILAEDNQVSGQQPTLDPVYQQYRLIKDFELKVTAPLNTSQDQDTTTMRLTGAANVYPFLIPNVGDMFIADSGDGREGVFKVTLSERRSVFKDTTYSIEYEMISLADAERIGDLYSKVQQTLQFVKDFLMHGQNPMLLESEFAAVQKLAERYHEMLQVYFRMVFSDQFKTICIPGQELPAYDPFQVKAVAKWFETRRAEQLRHVRLLNVDGDPAMGSFTLWDALNDRNPRHMKFAARQMGLVKARTFERNPMLEGIYWSGIEHVVYPKSPTVSVNFEQIKTPKPVLDENVVEAIETSPTLPDALADPTPEDPSDDLPAPAQPLIWPVLQDDHYVFTQAFYDKNAAQMSMLELAVWDYLDGKPINRNVLLALAETYHLWGSLERYYYMPVALLLIKASIRYL